MAPLDGIQAAQARIQEIERFLDNLRITGKAAKAEVGGAADFESILQTELAPESPEGLENLVENEAEKQGVDPDLMKGLVKAESGFNPYAVSAVGAQGLTQLMPATAKGLGVTQPFNPQDNVEGGTKYLKSLLDKYHSVPNALAAYNAGPGAVDKYGGIPPYKETREYVNRVLSFRERYAQEDKAD